jgi:muramoyltetrapeptide carboxypeptidase LdcA involved in peptidoglycan recycling
MDQPATFAKLLPGDRVAVVSPAWAAPGFAPAVHEQAISRIIDELGLVPVEYPTTRVLGASAEARAADVNAAFADPTIRAIFATIGGDDQITVVPHLTKPVDPKPFLGYSDNTNLLNWLHAHCVPGYYGGSTQVHLGAGPSIDAVHLASLRAALFDGGELEVTEPGESEDMGVDWLDPAALTSFGVREPTDPWTWHGPASSVSGRTWGGCLEVIDQIAVADRMPSVESLRGGILLVETSEEMPAADQVMRWMRALGERGVLAASAGVIVARPPGGAAYRDEQRDAVLAVMHAYNPQAVVCIGVPFGHTRPQWILPYGGSVRLDGVQQRVFADYT